MHCSFQPDYSLQGAGSARISNVPCETRRLTHAIADRESVILLGARFFAITRRGDAIRKMPWSELIGRAWACRQPQPELALGLTGQMQDHNSLPGPILQRNRTG